jgi:hypothetical protein
MKINQVIWQGLILSLLTAFPVFAKTETSKTNITPDKRFSSVRCETIKGRIDSNDPIFNQNPNSRYDGYLINAEVGTIVFAELTAPQEDYSRFSPMLTFRVIGKSSGVVYADDRTIFSRVSLGLLPRYAWYVSSPQSDEELGYNLNVYSPTAGNYELKIAYTKPRIDFSESQIKEVVDDFSESMERVREIFRTGNPDKKKPYLVDFNSLCQ